MPPRYQSDPPVLPLLSFPAELLLLVASNVPIKGLASLVLTCRYLHALLNPQLYTVGAPLVSPITFDTPLHWAAEHNQLVTARLLLQRGDPSITTTRSHRDGATPFLRAVSQGHLDLVKLLYSNTLMHIKDAEGYKPFQTAAKYGQNHVLRFLYKKHPEFLNSSGSTPLHLAVSHIHLGTAVMLLDLGSMVNAIDEHGRTPLSAAVCNHTASSCKELERICQLLIAAGADVNLYHSMSSALHYAGIKGCFPITKLLLSHGANIMAVNEHDRTPLHVAMISGSESVVEALLAADTFHAYSRIFCGGQTLLSFSMYRNDPSNRFLQRLIDAGADVNQPNIDQQTPLWTAVLVQDESSCLKILLKNGADPNLRDASGSTPLHDCPDVEDVRLLLTHGASVHVRDLEGQTPLFNAVERGNEDTVALLLDHGADVNEADNTGMSPLSRACAQCHAHINPSLVKLLIARGANVRSKDREGMGALHYASREGHVEVVEALLRGGAKARDRGRNGDNALDMAEANRRTRILDMLRENMGMVKA